MKYIDTDKLIANLERQNTDKKIIQPLIRIIDSHQQEHPEVGLEQEIENELRSHYNDDQDVYWWNYLKNSFRHFYELGLNARKEE